MPKRFDITAVGDNSGIDVTWYKTSGEIAIGGWYDSFVGLESERMSLGEFFQRLGITEKDCRKAFKEKGDD